MYQALFRDQEALMLNQQIDDLIAAPAEPSVSEEEKPNTYLNYKGDLNNHLLTEYIPKLVAAYDKENFEENWQVFVEFMGDYRPEKDIDQIKALLPKMNEIKGRKHIELICQKITAIKEEQFDMVKMIDELIDHVYG